MIWRHDIHFGEYFEAVDDSHHDDKRSHGRQKRKLYLEENLPLARSIDTGGFQVRFRDTLKPGQEQNDIVANSFPYRKENDREHGSLLAVEPLH